MFGKRLVVAPNLWLYVLHAFVFSYLLSLQTSPLNGVGAASVRMVLVGSQSPTLRPNFQVDFETIRFTEVVEFALSLSLQSAKDAFTGLPHLQPYKLLRAWQLSEIGSVKEAVKSVPPGRISIIDC